MNLFISTNISSPLLGMYIHALHNCLSHNHTVGKCNTWKVGNNQLLNEKLAYDNRKES